ncbi:MAG TPA: hypothetical protein VGL07_12800 [Buttiauxella sp.]|jgi:hypothetical protein
MAEKEGKSKVFPSFCLSAENEGIDFLALGCGADCSCDPMSFVIRLSRYYQWLFSSLMYR